MLVLTIGDLYVPERAIAIPAKFRKLLQPRGKIDKVLCLGNVTTSKSTLEFLKSISNDFQMVRGEFDEDLRLPQSLVFNYDNLKIGLLNGFQVVPKNDPLSLLNHARMMDVDILIYGSTHKVEAYTLDGKFFVNPGTGTGAYSTDTLDKEDRLMINKIVNEINENNKVKIKQNEIGKIGKDNKDDVNITDKSEGETETKSELESNGTTESVTHTKNEKETETTSIKNQPEIEYDQTKENPDKLQNILQDLKLDETTNQVQLSIDEYMEPFPSFCLLDVKDSTCILYLYTLVEGEVKIDKLTYSKEDDHTV